MYKANEIYREEISATSSSLETLVFHGDELKESNFELENQVKPTLNLDITSVITELAQSPPNRELKNKRRNLIDTDGVVEAFDDFKQMSTAEIVEHVKKQAEEVAKKEIERN